MDAQELRQMTDIQLAEELNERKQELFNLRFQNVTGQLDNPRALVALRRAIARIKTVMREREMALAGTGTVQEDAQAV